MPDPTQSERARLRATAIRSARARMKREMKEGNLDIVELLSGNNEQLEPLVAATRLEDLLRAVPSFGPATVQEILVAEELDGDTRIGMMTFERRAQVAALVRDTRDGNLPVL